MCWSGFERRKKSGCSLLNSKLRPVLAGQLVERGIDYFTVYVCENLGSPDERVTRGSPAEIARQKFGPLNVMVLVRKPGVADKPTNLVSRRLFGNPDEGFLQSKPKRGLLTPSEVRAIALSEMELRPDSILWDVAREAVPSRSKPHRSLIVVKFTQSKWMSRILGYLPRTLSVLVFAILRPFSVKHRKHGKNFRIPM